MLYIIFHRAKAVWAKTLIALCAALCLMSAPLAADDLEGALGDLWKMLPVKGELLIYPDAEEWSSYGPSSDLKPVPSSGAHNDKARLITIKEAQANPWDVAAQVSNGLPVKSGDTVFAQIWMRAAKRPAGKASADLPLYLQLSREPYSTFAQGSAQVGEVWQPFYIHGRADRSFAPGELNLSVHMGGAAQSIELGSVFFMNLGAGDIDPAALPVNGQTQARGGQAQARGKPAAPSASPARAAPTSTLPAALRSDLEALQARLPKRGVLISNPSIENWAPRGEDHSAKTLKDRGVPGGQALHVETKKAGDNQWDVGAATQITGPIAEGDAVLVAYYARAIEVHNEAQTGIISAASVELNQAPYTSIQVSGAKLPKDWDIYYVAGKATRSYAPGEAQVSLHLGAVRQTVALGPVYVINLGQGVDPRTLPRNSITYEGRAVDAPWRKDAMARIEQHRKGDLSLTVTDQSGAPISGATVRAEMTRHDFPFGTFTNYNYGTKQAAKFPKVGETIERSFNAVTMPLYWADWGWETPEKQAEFKRGVRFIAEKGTPWRGHVAVWPGERYLPSRILAMEAGSKAQREAVLDHVREVMSFIAPHKPFAMDVVNEPRVNHYFKDNGDAELVPDIFRAARKAAPNVPLFTNDYSILNGSGMNRGSIDYYHSWLEDMLGKDVPVDGIGFQSHFSAGLTPPARVFEILDEFKVYGLPLHITEFDIDTLDEQAQADYTRDFLTITFSHPSVEAFIAWGFWEGDHWKPDAAMIREDWSEKPAFTAWRKAIYEDFWTRASAQTNGSGQASLRGFYGDYTVTTTVNGVSKTHNVTLPSGGAALTITH